MSVQGVLVTLSSGTPVVLAGDGIHGTIRVTLRNKGTGTAYLGSSSVTTSGYGFTTGDNPLQVTIYGGETLYGMSTGTPSLDVLRFNDTTNS